MSGRECGLRVCAAEVHAACVCNDVAGEGEGAETSKQASA